MQPSGWAVAVQWIRPTLDVIASVVVVLSLWEGAHPAVQRAALHLSGSDGHSLVALAGDFQRQIRIALGVTLSEILTGAAIGSAAGLLIAVLMVSSRLAYRLVYPWIVGIQTIPKVAIAPLMLVWFGFGIESKILIVALTSMFPVMVNTISGLRATEHDQIALIQALCGNRMQVLRYVQIPAALPYIFAGLNTAIVLAVIAAIVGEFVGARAGIGYLILQANFALDLAAVFALLTLLGILGVTLSLCIRAIEKRVCFWNRRS